MSADPKTLQISIMGREFRVACPDEEQKELLEAVEYLNRKMHEIATAAKWSAWSASRSWPRSTSLTNCCRPASAALLTSRK